MDFRNNRRNLLVPTFWSAMGICEFFKSTDTGLLLNFNLLTFTASLIIHIPVSQEEWTKVRESVPYVKIYRYNPKHLYPKLNGYGDNGQRNFKL